MGRFFTFSCRLMAKPDAIIDTDDFGGTSDDINTVFDLSGYRSSCELRDTINEMTKNGLLTLRAPNGLFTKKKPILTDEQAKHKFLIEIQLGQRTTDNAKLFRFEIRDSTKSKTNAGSHVNLVLIAPDVRLDEFLDSEVLVFVTPREAFKRRIENFNDRTQGAGTADNDIVLDMGTNYANIAGLPDDPRLKQVWSPTDPVKTKEHLKEIIERVSQPTRIGSLNKDYFWEIIPKPNTFDSDGNISTDNRQKYDVKASLFGNSPSTPIIISSTSDEARDVVQQSSAILDNSRFKDILVGKGKKGAHSIPMAHAKFVSDYTHATFAADYVRDARYETGDYVKHNDKLWKLTGADIPDAPPVFTNDDLGSAWSDIIKDYRNPWMDTGIWRSNLAGSGQLGGHYAGCFHDFNIVRRDFEEENEFASVSVKDVISILNTPPVSPQHGQRWLIGTAPTGTWAGNANRIAQWSSVDNEWKISKAPSGDEIVNVDYDATIRHWTGSVWEKAWSVGTTAVNAKHPSPYIPVDAISAATSRLNVAGKAVKFTFDWNVFESTTQLKDDVLPSLIKHISPVLGLFGVLLSAVNLTFLGKNIRQQEDYDTYVNNFYSNDIDTNDAPSDSDLLTKFGVAASDALALRNRSSRRYGWSIKLPWSRSAIAGITDSEGLPLSTLSFFNMGNIYKYSNIKGWNKGSLSENLGAIRGVEFWQKVQHVNKEGNTITGLANIPMIHWFRDLFGRVVYHPYTMRVHNDWGKYRIPAGPGASLTQYDSRIDELQTIFGYTLPFNHHIKERELTGGTFDWAHVVEMGSFCTLSYSENNIYVGGQDAFLNLISENVMQHIVKNQTVYQLGNFLGIVDMEYVITDKAHLYLEDLHFVKDAYVTSDNDVVNGPGDNPRMDMVHLPAQDDYVNIKGILNRQRSRQQFHPEQHIISSTGNVNLKAGERFFFGDDIVNRGEATEDTDPAELTGQQVNHIIQGNGYTCATTAVRKYQTETDTV